MAQPQLLEAAPLVTATVTDATVNPGPATEISPGIAAIRTPAAPVANAPRTGPLATIVISLLSAFGLLPPAPPVPVTVVGVPSQPEPGTSSIDGVTGVKVGRSNVQIPVGNATYTGAADWYFPTQVNGTVQAQGVMWLQHGFLASKSWYSALAQQLPQQTNSIVVVPNIPSFPFVTCSGCTLSDVPIQEGVAALFADSSRTSLNDSARAAGYLGTLPEKFILTGHSAGGGLAAAAGGFYTDTVALADNDLPGNTQAVYTLAAGWINDMYASRGPTDPRYGIYGQPEQVIVLGPTATVVLGPPPFVDVNECLGTCYEVRQAAIPVSS